MMMGVSPRYVELEVTARFHRRTDRDPLEARGLPVPGAKHRAPLVGNDVPGGNHLEDELPDAQHPGARHEIDVTRGLPDPRPAYETQGGCKALVDPVERDKVVEKVVVIVGGDPPGLRRAG